MGSYYWTASQIRNCDERILAALIAACGVTDPDVALSIGNPNSFTVDTDAGELFVSFQRGDDGKLPSRGKVGLPGCVCTRFTDLPRALDVLGSDAVGLYSGKWNFHFSGGYPPEVMADELRAINPRNFKLRPRFWSPKDVDVAA
jgi:hypothetical protein